MKTRAEIDKLIIAWSDDPSWEIEDTEGFEDHKPELQAFRIQMEKQWQERSAKEHADAIALLRAPGLQSLGISAEDRGSDTRMDRYSALEVLRAVAEMLLPLKQQLDRLDAHVDANQGELAQQVDLLRAALREVRP